MRFVGISGLVTTTTVTKPLTKQDLDEKIEIWLEETGTIWMVDIASTVIAPGSDEATTTKERNAKYEEVC